MHPPIAITSADNPRVKAAASLREHKHRRRSGAFLAQGLREVQRAAQAGLVAREVFWCPALLAGKEAALEQTLALLRGQVPPPRFFTLTPALLEKISSIEHPEGIAAVFAQRPWVLADLHAQAQRRLPGTGLPGADLWLVAVGIEKPGNLGAMVRSADAAGAWGVLVADAVADVWNPNAIRASTGAVFEVPVLSVTTQEILDFLHQRGARVLAATPAAQVRYTAADMTGPVAIVIGPEDSGLPPAWLDVATQQVVIPMRGRVADSLNASAAAALLLFEAARQRTAADA